MPIDYEILAVAVVALLAVAVVVRVIIKRLTLPNTRGRVASVDFDAYKTKELQSNLRYPRIVE